MTDFLPRTLRTIAIAVTLVCSLGCRAINNAVDEPARDYQKEIDEWNEKHPDDKKYGGVI